MRINSLEMQDLESIAESQLENFDPELPEEQTISEIQTGIKTWKNKVNNFQVIMLHRTADPDKRSPEWVAKTRAGMSTSDWLIEYELHWEVLAGRPVYQDEFSMGFHVSKKPLGWNPKLIVARGWDFGLYPACVFTQLFPFSRLMVLRECIGEDIDTEAFTYEVSRLSNEWFPDARFVEFIDPTGRNRAGTDGRAYTRILTQKPLRARKIILGANAKVARRSAVVDFLKENVKGQACILIDPSCEYLIKGFDGGYIYAFTKGGAVKPEPEKNIFSHIHDALQYACSKIRTVNMRLDSGTIKIVEPRFNSSEPELVPINGISQPINRDQPIYA